MSDKGQDRWTAGNEQSEVEGHGYLDKRHEAPTGDDGDAETAEVQGRLMRGARDAADAESDLMARDKEK